MPRSARLRFLVPVAVGALMFGLAACGGDKTKSSDNPSSTPTAAASNPNAGPPPSELVLKVLQAGTGETVKSGELVSINYQGTNWTTGAIFDQSYGRGEAAFETDRVVKGFGAALVGQKVGAKLVVGIPPEFGYGTAGQPSANISGTDTLVFVIEIKGIGLKQCNAKPGSLSDSVRVTGAFGKKAVPSFTKGLKATRMERTIVKQGKGAVTNAGDTATVLLSIYNARTGKLVKGGSNSAGSLTVGDQQIPVDFQAGINCMKAGSRVVTVFPAKAMFPSGNPEAGIKATDTLVLATDVISVTPKAASPAPPAIKEWTNPPTVKFNGANPPTLTLPKA